MDSDLPRLSRAEITKDWLIQHFDSSSILKIGRKSFSSLGIDHILPREIIRDQQQHCISLPSLDKLGSGDTECNTHKYTIFDTIDNSKKDQDRSLVVWSMASTKRKSSSITHDEATESDPSVVIGGAGGLRGFVQKIFSRLTPVSSSPEYKKRCRTPRHRSRMSHAEGDENHDEVDTASYILCMHKLDKMKLTVDEGKGGTRMHDMSDGNKHRGDGSEGVGRMPKAIPRKGNGSVRSGKKRGTCSINRFSTKCPRGVDGEGSGGRKDTNTMLTRTPVPMDVDEGGCVCGTSATRKDPFLTPKSCRKVTQRSIKGGININRLCDLYENLSVVSLGKPNDEKSVRNECPNKFRKVSQLIDKGRDSHMDFRNTTKPTLLSSNKSFRNDDTCSLPDLELLQSLPESHLSPRRSSSLSDLSRYLRYGRSLTSTGMDNYIERVRNILQRLSIIENKAGCTVVKTNERHSATMDFDNTIPSMAYLQNTLKGDLSKQLSNSQNNEMTPLKGQLNLSQRFKNYLHLASLSYSNEDQSMLSNVSYQSSHVNQQALSKGDVSDIDLTQVSDISLESSQCGVDTKASTISPQGNKSRKYVRFKLHSTPKHVQ